MLDVMMRTIEKHRLIDYGDKIVIGLSGGADSLSMTHALLRQKEVLGIELIAVHVNHKLRGEAADSDASFVQAFCRQHEIECVLVEVDVSKLAIDRKLSFEEAGRIVRYNAFVDVLNTYGAQKIAVAQNRNDVVETFFINLFRGSGIDGLSSIDYIREDMIIRPLLDIERIEIDAYCKANSLWPRHDHTNDEVDYVRNRIRNDLLPKLREDYNPSINDAVMRTISMMRAEKSYWLHKSEQLSMLCCKYENGMALIDLSQYGRLHEVEKLQLLRYAIKRLKGSIVNLSYDKYQMCASLERTGTKCELGDGWALRRSHDALILYREEAINEVLSKPLFTCIVPKEAMHRFKLDASCVAVDADKISGNLQARNRKPGDRFVPLGMKGHKKIKSFFIDEKVPFTEREKIMLVCDEEKIIWVENKRISELCKITESTKNVMIMSFQELVESK